MVMQHIVDAHVSLGTDGDVQAFSPESGRSLCLPPERLDHLYGIHHCVGKRISGLDRAVPHAFQRRA